MIPWMTVGGADRVIRMLIRNWVTQKRTVVVFMTSRLEPGMVDKSRDLRLLTPYVYNLWDFLPIKQWYDFVAATIGALDSPVMFNMGSAWFFDSARALRRHFPHLRIVDQQFNSVGHLSWNRDLADVIDLTIAAYDGLARDLTKNGRKSDVVPVYIGMEEIPIPHQDQSLEFRNHVGVEEGASLILFVGRLSKEKRPEWITRLSSSLRRGEARVVMVGDGPLREEIAEAAKPEEGLVWIPDLEDIEPALAAADLVVLPSRIEGIPLIALEALSLGTPIVATRVGGLPDLEDEEGVTLTDPDDFDAFVEAVRESLRTDFGRIELSERFSSEQMLDHYDKLLFEGE
jgi:glycosyltransferase involved in cell wall biosynthesis